MKKLDLGLELTIALFCFLISVITIALIFKPDPYDYKTTGTYTVVSGDTLWEIASGIKTDEQNILAVIDEIKAINNCGDSLKIGQKLELPIYK